MYIYVYIYGNLIICFFEEEYGSQSSIQYHSQKYLEKLTEKCYKQNVIKQHREKVNVFKRVDLLNTRKNKEW